MKIDWKNILITAAIAIGAGIVFNKLIFPVLPAGIKKFVS